MRLTTSKCAELINKQRHARRHVAKTAWKTCITAPPKDDHGGYWKREVKRPPKRRVYVVADRKMQRSSEDSCDNAGNDAGTKRLPGSVDAVVSDPDVERPATADVNRVSDDDHVVAGTNGYHPVRRRTLLADKPVTVAVVATPPENNRRDREPLGWLKSCWRPTLLQLSAADDRSQQNHHHHRNHRAHRQRHHHHAHHFHMWTSSCCWWLLLLYAAVVVIASFARAAHSAKDGKCLRFIVTY